MVKSVAAEILRKKYAEHNQFLDLENMDVRDDNGVLISSVNGEADTPERLKKFIDQQVLRVAEERKNG